MLFALADAVLLVGCAAVAALQPDTHLGRMPAAYGGVLISTRCCGA